MNPSQDSLSRFNAIFDDLINAHPDAPDTCGDTPASKLDPVQKHAVIDVLGWTNAFFGRENVEKENQWTPCFIKRDGKTVRPTDRLESDYTRALTLLPKISDEAKKNAPLYWGWLFDLGYKGHAPHLLPGLTIAPCTLMDRTPALCVTLDLASNTPDDYKICWAQDTINGKQLLADEATVKRQREIDKQAKETRVVLGTPPVKFRLKR